MQTALWAVYSLYPEGLDYATDLVDIVPYERLANTVWILTMILYDELATLAKPRGQISAVCVCATRDSREGAMRTHDHERATAVQ